MDGTGTVDTALKMRFNGPCVVAKEMVPVVGVPAGSRWRNAADLAIAPGGDHAGGLLLGKVEGCPDLCALVLYW